MGPFRKFLACDFSTSLLSKTLLAGASCWLLSDSALGQTGQLRSAANQYSSHQYPQNQGEFSAAARAYAPPATAPRSARQLSRPNANQPTPAQYAPQYSDVYYPEQQYRELPQPRVNSAGGALSADPGFDPREALQVQYAQQTNSNPQNARSNRNRVAQFVPNSGQSPNNSFQRRQPAQPAGYPRYRQDDPFGDDQSPSGNANPFGDNQTGGDASQGFDPFADPPGTDNPPQQSPQTNNFPGGQQDPFGDDQTKPRQPEPRQPEPRQPEPRQPEPRQPEPRQPEPRQLQQLEPRQPPAQPEPRQPRSRAADPLPSRQQDPFGDDQTDPRATDPRATDPRATDPRGTDPRATDPRDVDYPPGVIRPETIQPNQGQPRMVQPLPIPGQTAPRQPESRSTDPRQPESRSTDPRQPPSVLQTDPRQPTPYQDPYVEWNNQVEAPHAPNVAPAYPYQAPPYAPNSGTDPNLQYPQPQIVGPSGSTNYAQPNYAQPNYAQPNYAQPNYAQPNYGPALNGPTGQPYFQPTPAGGMTLSDQNFYPGVAQCDTLGTPIGPMDCGFDCGSPNFYFSIFAGSVSLHDSDSTDGNTIFSESGPAFGVAIGQRHGNNLRSDLEFSYRSNDITSISSSDPLSLLANSPVTGDITSYSGMANAYWEFVSFPNECFKPYFGAGVGFTSINTDLMTAAGQSVIAPDQNTDTSLAYQFIGGVNYKAYRNMDLFVEYRYMAAESLRIDTLPGFGAGKYDYQTDGLFGGLRWKF